ncbi:response regulator [Butyrivibrio sp. X503]|uniref:response regulator transcription factor n=1 Tax=Butyrivibrio sp. X503 TaxID=2364878 RepID=UPI000EAAC498|nr:response regulator [Butyrivibrio sp. X503]RKM57415.1 response regulator [Butyrivibrio sp. X503]
MRVLIVDDDIATVDVIRDTVDWTSLDVEDVFTAYNIKEAKKILTDEPIDIVISDIEMPKGSGIELLKWYREQELDGEFLFLTCHESFDYATSAMKLHVFEYLLKPFDVHVMEATLRKMIGDLLDKRNIKETSELGKWAKKNTSRLYNNFWMDILTSKIAPSASDIEKEIASRRLDVDPKGLYRLVVSRLSGIEKDREIISISLILFILENIHMEVLLGDPQANFATGFEVGGEVFIVSIVPVDEGKEEQSKKDILEKSNVLLTQQKKILFSEMTTCIGRSVHMHEFYDAYQKIKGIIQKNVSYYGTAFCEEDVANNRSSLGINLDSSKLEALLSSNNKMEFMSIIKTCLNETSKGNALTDDALNRLVKEIQQIVYTYLGKKQIGAIGLIEDENLGKLEKNATKSVIDMIKWVGYLLDATFEYEKKILKSFTICDKINTYIRQHYKEHIGRNEIAEEFFLAPEYLSKVYKKETGISINEAIAACRVEQAKLLLDRGERVSDVAEKVGFDNFTYFSTTFKKLEGVSPTKYKKK